MRPPFAGPARASLRVFAVTFGLGVAIAGCDDDGKAKLYEPCDANLPCSEGLACLAGSCTRSCEHIAEVDAPAVGSCQWADECVDELSGCCLLNHVDGFTGTGNCTASPPPPAGE